MSFALYLDENVDVLLARLLNDLGHDIVTARDAGMAQASDDSQFEFAAAQRRAIFTHDITDYTRIMHAWDREGRSHYGVIVSHRRSVYALRGAMLRLFQDFPDGIEGCYMHIGRPPA